MSLEIILLVCLIGAIVTLIVLIMRRGVPSNSGLGDAVGLKQDINALVGLLNQNQAQVQERLDRNNQYMQTNMHEQMKQSSAIIREVTDRLTKLDETNRRVVDITSELKTLQNVLQNPKQRGVLGEYYLSQVLENILSPGQFKLQHAFSNGDVVDAVVVLDRGKILPVDSKFSLENYNRLIEATDPHKRDLLAKQFRADLKGRIDETSKYIRPQEGTMDFAFMFIPSEAIYYDLLVNQVGATATSARDLIEYAFRDKHVIIVSPTSFMAYLQTVLQGLRSLQIEEQAREIQQRVGQLAMHLKSYDIFMQKMGNSLGTTVSHYNTAYKEFKKVDRDVVKIADTDPAIEPLLVDKPSIED
ncbi:DNA recombination protein RmuC [Candidatus Saccharibacteria bacterium]|nr:DNA recombination protein RmuC [Candidatus Saccharibacteria bacterium]